MSERAPETARESSEIPTLRAWIFSTLAVAVFVGALWMIMAWRDAPPAPPPFQEPTFATPATKAR